MEWSTKEAIYHILHRAKENRDRKTVYVPSISSLRISKPKKLCAKVVLISYILLQKVVLWCAA